jgi:Flp pilus assembly protein TadG
MKKLLNERGAAAVELALLLPILATLLFGIVSAGRYYTTRVSLTHAAREGARTLALGGTFTDAETRVIDTSDGLTGVTVTASGDCPTTQTTPPTDVTVTASVPFTFSIPFVSLSATTIAATGVMRCNG